MACMEGYIIKQGKMIFSFFLMFSTDEIYDTVLILCCCSTSVFRGDIKLCHWVPKGSIFLKIDQNQLSFLFGFYLKKERKKIERKKVRARPLCHPKNPPKNPFVLVDMSLFLYRKEKGTKLKVKVGIQQ